jgi:hypothetical protein
MSSIKTGSELPSDTADHVDKPADPDRVQLAKRNEFWEVKVDGVFHSDYRRKEQALKAVALIALSL